MILKLKKSSVVKIKDEKIERRQPITPMIRRLIILLLIDGCEEIIEYEEF